MISLRSGAVGELNRVEASSSAGLCESLQEDLSPTAFVGRNIQPASTGEQKKEKEMKSLFSYRPEGDLALFFPRVLPRFLKAYRAGRRPVKRPVLLPELLGLTVCIFMK